jgi:RNA polymerase sigma-70 factor (ECF subfamily)
VDDRAQRIEVLYRERFNAFLTVVASSIGDRDAARDVVQEAFARAFRSRGTLRDDGALEAWVWRIVLRTAFERRSNGHRAIPLDGVSEPILENRERDPELVEALRRLSPRRRLVVFLRYFADLSYEQIAEVCDVSPGTVSATLSQARSELAASLDPEGVTR